MKMSAQHKALAKMNIQQLRYEIDYCNVQPPDFIPIRTIDC